ncbi:MAG: electron transport complex subunit RsxC [Treponema sp.]|nr:electron transport complex subunit RsxC [Treponema sp.]
MKKLGGILVPHFKNTAAMRPETLPVPAEVRLPMSMHEGAPANPVVKTGDTVKIGQLIGEAAGAVSSPVYSSVSGKIKQIDYIDSLTGKKSITITIASDGMQEYWEGITPPVITNTAEFLEAVKNSGAVGLGGAGYPTAAKLTLKENVKLDYILVNGAECEPFISSDTRTMIDDAADLFEGMKLLQKYLDPKNVIICIEENKPEPIAIMKKYCAGTPGMEVRKLPSLYPQGERKVLVYNVTGRIVPEGARLPDIGCVVINCSTVAAFAKYIRTGIPLVSRCITVDGPGIVNPKNVIAPIGTPVRSLVEFCGGLKDGVKMVTLGGPMMGTAIPDLDIPVVKVTSAVLAFTEKSKSPFEAPETTACLKCGRCIVKCPMNLMPPYIENAFELKKPELLQKYKVNMCLECGCCAYTCPAKRPLVQVMSLSKDMLWNYQAALKAAKAAEVREAQ